MTRPARVTDRMPLLLMLTGIGMLGLSFVLAEWRAGNLEADLRERFVMQALGIAQALQQDPALATLTFGPDDADRPAFRRLGARLAGLARLAGYRGIWTLAQRDGEYRFGPESYAADDPLASQPGTAYRQPPPEIARVLASRQALATDLYEDEFGRFVSALAPILLVDDDRVPLILGIDLPAADWSLQLYRARLFPMLIGVTFFSLFFGASRLLRWRQRHPEALGHRLRHLETLLAVITGLLLTCDITLTVAGIEAREISRTFERLVTLHAQTIQALWPLDQTRNGVPNTAGSPDPERLRAVLAADLARHPQETELLQLRLLGLDPRGVDPADTPAPLDLLAPGALHAVFPFFVPEGMLALTVEATAGFTALHRRHMTWMTGLLGLLMTGIATVFVATQRGRQIRLEQTCDEHSARLMRNEAHLDAIANAARDAIIMTNEAGAVIYWNPAAERILGYGRDEALDRDLHQLIAPPEDFARYRQRAGAVRLGSGRKVFGQTLEMDAIRKDGQRIAIELSLSSLEREGQWHAVGILRNIDDRKRAEERLLRLNACLAGLGADYRENIDRIVTVCGELLEGDCALYNRLRDDRLLALGRWRAPSDLPDEDRAEGHICHDLIRSRAAANGPAEPAGAPDGIDSDILCIGRLEETPYLDSDPTVRRHGLRAYVGHAVRCAGQPVGSLCVLFRRTVNPGDAEFRVLGILAAALSAEENRHLALTRAERASQAKSEFLSSMSHELRTPMNAVLGFAQLLDCDPALPPEQRETVHEILRGGHHLLELINDVLDLAQIEAGHLRIASGPVVLGEVLDESLNLIRPLARARGVRVEPADPGTLVLQADRGRLRQILINLLSNAVKYNRRDGWIRLQCERRDNPARARVCVIDSGIGIADADRERLFDPFTRLHDDGTMTASAPVEGTGIGLAVTRRLVELMDGAIGVDSTPGQGSTFWFELPAATDAPAAAERPAPFVPAAPPPRPAAPPSRLILHIDDQPANLRLVAGVLTQRPGIRVLSAVHPHLGLELAAAHRPDLILLDLHMPGINGYAVFRRLRNQPATANIPVIALTAHATVEDRARGARAGFDGYLTKPLDMREFLATVDRWIPSPSATSDPSPEPPPDPS